MIKAATAPEVVENLIENKIKKFTESRVLQRLLDEDIRYERGFFEAFGKEDGYHVLGSMLLDTDDSQTKESILNILVRAMKAEGTQVKMSMLLTMSLLPISYIFKPDEDVATQYMAMDVLITMFIRFKLADYRSGSPKPTFRQIEQMKQTVISICVMIQVPLLNDNQKVSLAATKTIGFLAKFKSSRFYLRINDYLHGACYDRIINQLFNRYGETLATHVYMNLIRNNYKAAEPFFTQYNLERLKKAMIKNRLKDSLYFVLLNKISSETLRPNIPLLCELGIIELLISVIKNCDVKFSPFNRIQALTIIKKVILHLKDEQMALFLNKSFFKGLDELMKHFNPIPKTKMTILLIVEGILKNGWNQCLKQHSRVNAHARFLKRKTMLYKTIVDIKKTDAGGHREQKLLKEKATSIVEKHLL